MLLHWRKKAIPECPSIFIPALATVGDADEEMVGGMVDDAQTKIAVDRVIRYYDAGLRSPGRFAESCP